MDDDSELSVNELHIDPTRLDTEWLRQPKLYYLAALDVATKKEKVDRLESEMEITKAELHQSVTKNPSRFGATKETDPAIKAAVAYHLAKKPIVRKLRRARHDVDIAQAFLGALDQKKRALESHVTLFVHNYNSKPREPKDAHEHVQRMRDNRAFKYRSDRKKKKR